MKEITVKVPGSTSNIGPGYDCLGVALGLSNRVRVWPVEGEKAVPSHPMVEAAADAYFATTGCGRSGFGWEIAGDVPVSRGLGSSVTLRLGVLAALDALHGTGLGKPGLFEICTDLEGHPDNAGAATFGGFVLANAARQVFRFEVSPELKFVLLVPRFEVLTDAARRVLPEKVDRLAAVRNVGDAAAIAAAFAGRDYEKLAGAFADSLHQPFRAHLVPGMADVIGAGEAAGALGGFLSGSGSTICCLALGGAGAEAIATAMRGARDEYCDASVLVVEADNEGVVSVDG